MKPCVLVYSSIIDGHIACCSLDDAKDYEKSELFTHIGTVDPIAFLQFLLNVEDDLIEKYFQNSEKISKINTTKNKVKL